MIVQYITRGNFHEAFHKCGRGNQFSPKALDAIFDFLEGYSEDSREPTELDVIGICCDFSEITFDEVLEEQGEDDEDDALDEFERQLERNHGWVARLSGSFVYQG